MRSLNVILLQILLLHTIILSCGTVAKNVDVEEANFRRKRAGKRGNQKIRRNKKLYHIPKNNMIISDSSSSVNFNSKNKRYLHTTRTSGEYQYVTTASTVAVTSYNGNPYTSKSYSQDSYVVSTHLTSEDIYVPSPSATSNSNLNNQNTHVNFYPYSGAQDYNPPPQQQQQQQYSPYSSQQGSSQQSQQYNTGNQNNNIDYLPYSSQQGNSLQSQQYVQPPSQRSQDYPTPTMATNPYNGPQQNNNNYDYVTTPGSPPLTPQQSQNNSNNNNVQIEQEENDTTAPTSKAEIVAKESFNELYSSQKYLELSEIQIIQTVADIVADSLSCDTLSFSAFKCRANAYKTSYEVYQDYPPPIEVPALPPLSFPGSSDQGDKDPSEDNNFDHGIEEDATVDTSEENEDNNPSNSETSEITDEKDSIHYDTALQCLQELYTSENYKHMSEVQIIQYVADFVARTLCNSLSTVVKCQTNAYRAAYAVYQDYPSPIDIPALPSIIIVGNIEDEEESEGSPSITTSNPTMNPTEKPSIKPTRSPTLAPSTPSPTNKPHEYAAEFAFLDELYESGQAQYMDEADIIQYLKDKIIESECTSSSRLFRCKAMAYTTGVLAFQAYNEQEKEKEKEARMPYVRGGKK